MIGIIDYGMGNLYSVSKALERMNYDYFISSSGTELNKADGLILPGVGSFKDAMSILHEKELVFFLKESVAKGTPLLGICLGMQLLFEEGEENGLTHGLGFLKGRITKIPGVTADGETYKVPHMGWNDLEVKQQSPLLEKIDGGHVYFVHSYYAKTDSENVMASSKYDVEVPAVVGKGNVYGTQFHPEKSSDLGIKILQNYAAIVEKKVTL
ncbi:imidazole glycerol phosphate synthase subunit HisH [Bacillus nitroreducens]